MELIEGTLHDIGLGRDGFQAGFPQNQATRAIEQLGYIKLRNHLQSNQSAGKRDDPQTQIYANCTSPCVKVQDMKAKGFHSIEGEHKLMTFVSRKRGLGIWEDHALVNS